MAFRSASPFLPGAMFAVAALAQTPTWSTEHVVPGLPGRVSVIRTFQSEIHAGGTWFPALGGTLRGLARWDGAAWRQVGGGVQLLGAIGMNSQPQVLSMALWNGQLYFGGQFDRAGTGVHDNVASWDGAQCNALGTGIRLSWGDAEVRALAVYDNSLYAAGVFDSANGQPVASIARWDGTAWFPVSTGLTNSLNGTIGIGHALHVHNGRLYVGGEFDRAGGVAVANMAAWDGTRFYDVGGGTPYPVRAFTTWQAQLVAGAQMPFPPGNHMLGRWSGATWQPVGSSGPDLPVHALLTVGNDLYVGGLFGQPGPSFCRFDGSSWNYAGGVGGTGGLGGMVAALHEHAGEVIVGGPFEAVGTPPDASGAIVSAGIAATDGYGTWRGLGEGLGFDRPLRKVVRWRHGLVGVGNFTAAGTLRTNGIALFDGDRWTMLGSCNGGIDDAVVWQGNLIVTGAFTRIGGLLCNGIAQHDGTQWRFFTYSGQTGLCVHGSELYAAGGQSVRRFDGTRFVDIAPLTGIVTSLLSHRDGNLYLTTDNAFQHFVYRWDGTLATRIGTPDNFNSELASWGNDLLLAGRFTSINGVAASLMARWNGTSWSALPPVTGYQTQTFAEMDGVLYAAVNGDPRGFTLRLVNNAWQACGTPPMGVPTLLFPERGAGALWASGDWFQGGTVPMNNLGEWRTQPAWRNRQHGLAGPSGVPPLLMGRGSLAGNSPLTWTVEGRPLTGVLLGVGTARVDQPLRGGVLVPSPDAITFLLTDAQGTASLGLTFPPGLAPGSSFFSQAWLLDTSGPLGLTASNALQCIVP